MYCKIFKKRAFKQDISLKEKQIFTLLLHARTSRYFFYLYFQHELKEIFVLRSTNMITTGYTAKFSMWSSKCDDTFTL